MTDEHDEVLLWRAAFLGDTEDFVLDEDREEVERLRVALAE